MRQLWPPCAARREPSAPAYGKKAADKRRTGKSVGLSAAFVCDGE